MWNNLLDVKPANKPFSCLMTNPRCRFPIWASLWTLLLQTLNVSWCAPMWPVWLGYWGRRGRKSVVPLPDEWHSLQRGWWCARGRWRRSVKGKVWQDGDEGPEPWGQSAPPSCTSGHGPPPACSSLPHHPHLASGWLQGKLAQLSNPTENKSPPRKKTYFQPDQLAPPAPQQLHSC